MADGHQEPPSSRRQHAYVGIGTHVGSRVLKRAAQGVACKERICCGRSWHIAISVYLREPAGRTGFLPGSSAWLLFRFDGGHDQSEPKWNIRWIAWVLQTASIKLPIRNFQNRYPWILWDYYIRINTVHLVDAEPFALGAATYMPYNTTLLSFLSTIL